MWTKFITWLRGWSYRVARTATAKAAEALSDIALMIVTEVSTMAASGTYKNEIAVSKIKAIALEKGLEAGTSIIKKAIEDALAVAKEEGLGAYNNDRV